MKKRLQLLPKFSSYAACLWIFSTEFQAQSNLKSLFTNHNLISLQIDEQKIAELRVKGLTFEVERFKLLLFTEATSVIR